MRADDVTLTLLPPLPVPTPFNLAATATALTTAHRVFTVVSHVQPNNVAETSKIADTQNAVQQLGLPNYQN